MDPNIEKNAVSTLFHFVRVTEVYQPHVYKCPALYILLMSGIAVPCFSQGKILLSCSLKKDISVFQMWKFRA